MTQQIMIQIPHNEKGDLEYEKGGRFRMSGRGALALLVIVSVLAFACWGLDLLLR